MSCDCITKYPRPGFDLWSSLFNRIKQNHDKASNLQTFPAGKNNGLFRLLAVSRIENLLSHLKEFSPNFNNSPIDNFVIIFETFWKMATRTTSLKDSFSFMLIFLYFFYFI